MPILKILQWVWAVLSVVTTLCYAYQILYLFIPLFVKEKPHKPEKATRYAILIAARNEEAVLPHLLDSIRAQDYPAQLLTTYVVADNCTDATALVAAQKGARVFQRFNREQVGKGYALNALLQYIEQTDGLDGYDAFLVFDADNLLSPDYIRQINKVCSDGYDVFCGYRNSKNFSTGWISAGQSIWYLHDSTHLNRSRMLVGNPCAVSGTGFGFTRSILRSCGGWNFFTLTEDIEFNTWYTTRGYRAGYCHDAVLYDEQPDTFRLSWKQRTRWVQGGIQVSVRYAGDLLRGLLRGGRTAYASLETATLSLWGYSLGTVCGCLGIVTALAANPHALPLLLANALAGTYLSLFFMGAMTVLMEHRRIRASRAAMVRALFTFPVYMMAYVPITVSAFFRKFHWPPIEHTVAVSAEEILSGKN